MLKTIRTYYSLTKPGIIYGNAIVASAGFFLASKGNINISLFLSMIIGLSTIIAGSCVFNNYIDKDIDAKMQRTEKRARLTLGDVRKNILDGLLEVSLEDEKLHFCHAERVQQCRTALVIIQQRRHSSDLPNSSRAGIE